VNHGGVEGPIRNVTDSGFCVPLWAEGIGGVQILGATVDAGSVGVVSGSFEFGVIKTDTDESTAVVARGVARSGTPVAVPIESGSVYRLVVTPKTGTEQTLTTSGMAGDLAVVWASTRIEIRPPS